MSNNNNNTTTLNKRHLFKHAFTVSSQSVMRGSDVKKLRQKIQDTYKNVTGDQIDNLINKKKDVGQVKLPNKIQLISHQLDPIFFEYYDKLYPTVYTFFKIPSFLTTLYIYPQVYQYIESGADLMFQGILNKEDVPKIQGSLVSICLKGSNYPIAFGETIQDLSSGGTELKGKSVSIIHYLNDKLWEYGTKKLPDDFSQQQQQANDDTDDDEQSVQEGNEDREFEKEQDKKEQQQQQTTTTTTATTTTTTDNNNKEEEEEIKQNEITKEEMDELLYISFLGAIKKGISDSDLPIVLKTVFSKHMLYYQPLGKPEINLKKSSYKKVSTFLKEMEKQQYIELKEPTTGNIVVSKINRSNPYYSRFKVGEIVGTTSNKGGEANNNNNDQDQGSDNDDSNDSDGDDAFGSTQKEYIQIKSINEVYQIPRQLKDHFKNVFQVAKANSTQPNEPITIANLSLDEITNKKYYTGAEIQKLVSTYIIDQKLEDPVKRSKIKIDQFLTSIVPGASKLIQSGLIEKNQFFNCLKESLKKYFEITRVDNSFEIKEFDQISIQSKKIANRFVILVNNLHVFGIPIKELAQEGMKLFAASTSIDKTTLKIQGNDIYRVSQHIQRKYNIPKKYIVEIELAKKK